MIDNTKIDKYSIAIMETIFRNGIVKNANEVALSCNDGSNVGHYKRALTKLMHKKYNYITKNKYGYVASDKWGAMKNKDLWASFFDKKLINMVTRNMKRSKGLNESIFGLAQQMVNDYKKSDDYFKDVTKQKVKAKILKVAKN